MPGRVVNASTCSIYKKHQKHKSAQGSSCCWYMMSWQSRQQNTDLKHNFTNKLLKYCSEKWTFLVFRRRFCETVTGLTLYEFGFAHANLRGWEDSSSSEGALRTAPGFFSGLQLFCVRHASYEGSHLKSPLAFSASQHEAPLCSACMELNHSTRAFSI